ncbi:MAG: hypothetical protein KF720_10825 [Rubrivivax sp.]|nr:hypothetical protein [Rubrivivax sp.]
MCATNAAPSGSLRRALALLALAGAASGAAVAQGVYGWPVWSGGGVVYPWYFNAGGCVPGGVCTGWGWNERRPWRRPVAPEQPTFEDQDIWGTTGSPWGYVRRLPPPTPESQIQPRYRDASTLRPEFESR